jgi:hypothetical protein
MAGQQAVMSGALRWMQHVATGRVVALEIAGGQLAFTVVHPVQRACDRCSQGVMDADGPNGPGNDHLYGRCRCSCHSGEDWERVHATAARAEAALDIVRHQFDQRRLDP